MNAQSPLSFEPQMQAPDWCVSEPQRQHDKWGYNRAMRKTVAVMSMMVLLAVGLAVVLVESYRECMETGHDNCGRQWRGSDHQEK